MYSTRPNQNATPKRNYIIALLFFSFFRFLFRKVDKRINYKSVAFWFNTSFVHLCRWLDPFQPSCPVSEDGFTFGLSFLMPLTSWTWWTRIPVALCLNVVLHGPLDRPHCFASFFFSRLACWLVLLVAIEVRHGLSRCFAHVGLALAAGFGADPLGGVFVQVDDGYGFFQNFSKLFKSKNRSRSEIGKAAVVGRVARRSGSGTFQYT